MIPRVSIGLPVYNGAAYLRDSLASLLAQELEDFEIIVSDNASTDATEAIVRECAGGDPRVRYVRNERNLGAAGNYNQVVRLARAPYFKWAAYDDLVAPSHLRRCVEALDAAPRDVVLCYPRTLIIDGEGRVVGPYEDDLDLREDEPHRRLRHFVWSWSLCNAPFGVIRRDALLRTRLIQPYIGSDVTLLAELALLGKFQEIPESLFFRRIHAKSSRQGQQSLREVAEWFDPNSRGPGWFSPETRVFFHLLGAVRRAELTPGERLRSLFVAVVDWWARRARIRVGLWRRALRREAGRLVGQPR
jgi:glycosyltransferase involved in cell wall biosynthesis